jgi:phospholipid/cholesterol/gamma-HCH transport system substrate-binding protein
METRPNSLFVGICVVGLILGFIAFTAWIGQRQWGGGERESYLIYFENAVTGLLKGGSVEYQGVPIGTVEEIKLDTPRTNRVRVKVVLEKSLALTEDTIASLQLQGLTGNRIIRLKAGKASSPLLKAKPGKAYPVIRSTNSTLEDFLETLPETLKNVSEVSKAVSGFATEKNQEQVAEILANLRLFTQSLPNLTLRLERVMERGEASLELLSKTLIAWESSAQHISQTAKPLGKWFQKNQKHLDFLLKEGSIKLDTLLKDSGALMKKWNHLTDTFQQNPLGFFQGKQDQNYSLEP